MHNFFHEYLCSNPAVMHDLTYLSYFGGNANNQVYDGFQSMHDKVKFSYSKT